MLFHTKGYSVYVRFASLFWHSSNLENMFVLLDGEILFSVSAPAPSTKCPPSCSCLEDNTAYFGNNLVSGKSNPKPSREECVRSCQDHPQCQFWTWDKTLGSCYLKTSKISSLPTGSTRHVSGPKHCVPSS